MQQIPTLSSARASSSRLLRFSLVAFLTMAAACSSSSSSPTVAPTPTCGNSTVDPGETCDGNCPTSCDDGIACTMDQSTGEAASCSAFCQVSPIVACLSGDGCCPAACEVASDSDCSATCGNGVVEKGETCDGDCPATCDDGIACTQDVLTGSAKNCSASCSHQAVSQCASGDECCPAGCNQTTDSDCSATCGNGVVEDNETCDGDCPASCDDGAACTVDTELGSAANCSLSCGHQQITQCASGDGCCPAGCNQTTDSDCSATCGNSVVEVNETCDGDCPASCDDGVACTVDTELGSAANCSLSCGHQQITQCASGDGCCPAGCNHNSDSDCSPSCGNGVVEQDETCDKNCPASCNDGVACTLDTTTGSAANCSLSCSHQEITQCKGADGCCPAGCNQTNDSDCSPSCGNGVVEQDETCDKNCPSTCDDGIVCTIDSLAGSATNCSASCSHQAITGCYGGDGCCPLGCTNVNDTDCSPTCGNGVVEGTEECDDANQNYQFDGCTNCKINDFSLAPPIGGTYPRIVRLATAADGSFVVVWPVSVAGTIEEVLYGQRFAHDYAPLGSRFRVNEPPCGATGIEDNSVRVAGTPDGRFVVSWRGGSARTWWLRWYGADGLALTAPYELDEAIGMSVELGLSDDGRMLAVGTGYGGGLASFGTFGDGSVAYTFGDIVKPSMWKLGMSSDGHGMIIASSYSTGNTRGLPISVGGTVGSWIDLMSSLPTGYIDPGAVAVDSNGAFKLYWVARDTGSHHESAAYAQTFSQSGHPVGPRQVLDSVMAAGPGTFQCVHTHPDGRVLFGAGSVHQRVAANGLPVGGSFRPTLSSGFSGDVAFLPDGSLLGVSLVGGNALIAQHWTWDLKPLGKTP